MLLSLKYLATVLVVLIVFFIFWAEAMYSFAQKDRTIPFSVLFLLGSLSSIFYIVNNLIFSASFMSITSAMLVGVWLYYWGSTLYEMAGDRKKVWYYLTLLIPILALIYQFVKD